MKNMLNVCILRYIERESVHEEHVAGCFVAAGWPKSIGGETADMAVCDSTSP